MIDKGSKGTSLVVSAAEQGSGIQRVHALNYSVVVILLTRTERYPCLSQSGR